MTIDWTQTSRFSMPEDSVGYLLWQVTHAWQRQVESTLSALDITHLQFVLLAGIGWLTRDGDLIAQVQLAEFCNIDVMQISQVSKRLEVKKLIARSTHPTDTRAKVLRLTSTGERILKEALPLIEKLDEEFFGRSDRSPLVIELKRLHNEKCFTQL